MFSSPVEWRKIDETNIIFRCLPQVLSMLPVLESKGLLQEGWSGEGSVVIDGGFCLDTLKRKLVLFV